MISRLSRVPCVLSLLVVAATAAAQTPAGHADTSRKTDTVPGGAIGTAMLPAVKVAGRTVSVPPRFEDAYKRAATGRGAYFTREEIEATNPKDLAALMLRVPAVQVNDRGITFTKCEAGLPSPGSQMQTARVQVFIDNRRTSTSDGVQEVLKSIPVSSVQLMEVYTSVSRIPAEFVNDACAVIVIWTKSY